MSKKALLVCLVCVAVLVAVSVNSDNRKEEEA